MMVLTLDGEVRTIDAKDATPFAISIVASYVARSRVRAADLPGLIETIHATVVAMVSAETAPAEKRKLMPAVAIFRSIHHDYIICLEDGRKLKTMRRYLRTKYNLTPEAYRIRWGLPDDYPMTGIRGAAIQIRARHGFGAGSQTGPQATKAQTLALIVAEL